MTHPDDEFDPYAPRLWDADPDVCCAAFQLGACAHMESYDEPDDDYGPQSADRG